MGRELKNDNGRAITLKRNIVHYQNDKITTVTDEGEEVTLGHLSIKVDNNSGAADVYVKTDNSYTALRQWLIIGPSVGRQVGTDSLTTTWQGTYGGGGLNGLNTPGLGMQLFYHISSVGEVYKVNVVMGSSASPFNDNIISIERETL